MPFDKNQDKWNSKHYVEKNYHFEISTFHTVINFIRVYIINNNTRDSSVHIINNIRDTSVYIINNIKCIYIYIYIYIYENTLKLLLHCNTCFYINNILSDF